MSAEHRKLIRSTPTGAGEAVCCSTTEPVTRAA